MNLRLAFLVHHSFWWVVKTIWNGLTGVGESQEMASGYAEVFIVWNLQSKEKSTSYYQADLWVEIIPSIIKNAVGPPSVFLQPPALCENIWQKCLWAVYIEIENIIPHHLAWQPFVRLQHCSGYRPSGGCQLLPVAVSQAPEKTAWGKKSFSPRSAGSPAWDQRLGRTPWWGENKMVEAAHLTAARKQWEKARGAVFYPGSASGGLIPPARFHLVSVSSQ